MWFSTVLGVHRVQVTGVTSLRPDAVREVAEVPSRRPLARVDTVRVEARVSSLERVERVRVSRSWPRTIRIEVVERTAVAWVRVDGEVRSLDRYGVDFRTLPREPRTLVEVRVPTFEARARQQALQSAAAVLARIRADDPRLFAQVQRVEAATQDSVVLDLTKGRRVTWGSAAKPAEKLQVLEALLDIEASGYDVSAPEQPTTRK